MAPVRCQVAPASDDQANETGSAEKFGLYSTQAA
jgi:hypothetical protein